ncbi:uncharacterized protein LOC112502977 [Cynara cardunculus var. scolymus]|uniref:uncharacterized protein LOC112502977 n=1 Tax=Cynara cardunculus var. scolymus TaxID=59895 RepID=UPI000D62E29E|nr:uncharacterized protein LOC112502977 [Cynara cardunculus var. scolymus]
MRQRRCIELVNDYDIEILYHPGKANVVADALSIKEKGGTIKAVAMRMNPLPDLHSEVVNCQEEAMQENNFKFERIGKMISILEKNDKGILCFQGRIWLPRYRNIRETILDEIHKSWYSIRPSTNKMYKDLKLIYCGLD